MRYQIHACIVKCCSFHSNIYYYPLRLFRPLSNSRISSDSASHTRNDLDSAFSRPYQQLPDDMLEDSVRDTTDTPIGSVTEAQPLEELCQRVCFSIFTFSFLSLSFSPFGHMPTKACSCCTCRLLNSYYDKALIVGESHLCLESWADILRVHIYFYIHYKK